MADSSIGRLVVTLGANSAQLMTEFNRTQARSNTWATSVGKAGKAATAGFAIAAVGAVALSVGIIAIVNANADYIDSLGKTADKLDITTQKLQLMRYQGELSGVSIGVMDKSLERMTKTVSEAALGLGVGKRSIDELGLSAADLNAMSPDQQFKAIAEAMKGIVAQGDKTRLALDIFGKGGSGMITVMTGDLEAMEARFDSLGIAITRQQASIVESYNDTALDLDLLMSGFGQKLTVYLAGPFDEVLKYIEQIVIDMGGIDPAARTVAGAVISGMTGIVTASIAVVSSINDIKIAFKEAQLIANQLEQYKKYMPGMGLAEYISPTEDKSETIKKEIAKLEQYNSTADESVKKLDELKKALLESRDPAATGTGEKASTKTGTTNPAITPANGDQFQALIGQYDKTAKATQDHEKQIEKINSAKITEAEKTRLLAEETKKYTETLKTLTEQQKKYNISVGSSGRNSLGAGASGASSGDALNQQITGRDSKSIGATFSKYARSYEDSINTGDMEKAAHWIGEMQDRFQEIARTGLSGSYDMNAMSQYLGQTGAGIDGDISKVANADAALINALESLTQSLGEVNASFGTTTPQGTGKDATPTASVTFRLQSDGKEISGMLFGEPVFINNLTKFNDAYTRQTARAVAR
jgi:hypothetical protein